MKQILISILALIILFCGSCNSKREIDLKLPPYKSQYVVECYLVPGQKYKLLINESTGIENSVPLNPLVFAEVRIFHKNDTILLNEFPIIDTVYYKAYNYVSSRIVEYDTVNPYFLEIKPLNSDKVLRAQTQFIRRPKITELSQSSMNGDDYSLSLYVKDVDPSQTNYYFFNIVDSLSKYDFGHGPRNRSYLDDKLIINGKIGIFTSYKYGLGETLIAKAYHLTKAHYDFLTSLEEARNANGNPFGRPTFVQGNVSGGVGIFTSMNYDERHFTIEADTL